MKIFDSISAYNLVMLELTNLSSDYSVTIKIPKSVSNEELKLKYSQMENRIPSELWRNVNIITKSKDYNKLFELEEKFHNLGIRFDTGFGNGRDWELDWSFQYNKENDM